MKKHIYLIGLIFFFGAIAAQAQYREQENEILKNHVKTVWEYVANGSNKKTLLSESDYTSFGKIARYTLYENKKVALRFLYDYDTEQRLIRLLSITNQTDTIVRHYDYPEPDSAYQNMEVILGGIPDYFPNAVYLKNGLQIYTFPHRVR